MYVEWGKLLTFDLLREEEDEDEEERTWIRSEINKQTWEKGKS